MKNDVTFRSGATYEELKLRNRSFCKGYLYIVQALPMRN